MSQSSEPGRVQTRSWTPSDWQAEFLPKTQRYVLRDDDDRFGLRAGDVLLCMRYWLDPGEKLTVVARESDGYDPSCNVYRSQVERVQVVTAKPGRTPSAEEPPSVTPPKRASTYEPEDRVVTVHEEAAAALLDPYLEAEPPDGWHLIDNAQADDLRHALEVAIQRMRAVRVLPMREWEENDADSAEARSARAYNHALVIAAATVAGES